MEREEYLKELASLLNYGNLHFQINPIKKVTKEELIEDLISVFESILNG